MVVGIAADTRPEERVEEAVWEGRKVVRTAETHQTDQSLA